MGYQLRSTCVIAGLTPLVFAVSVACSLASNPRPFAGSSSSSTRVGAPQLLSAQGSSRGTAYGMQNKFIQQGADLFATYLDVGSRAHDVKFVRLDAATLAVSEALTLGQGKDNHAGGMMLADSKRNLHIFYGAHADALKYRFTTSPPGGGNPSQWSTEKIVADGVTYPNAVILPSDDILLTARFGTFVQSANPWHLHLYKIRGGEVVEDRPVFFSNQLDDWQTRYTAYSSELLLSPDGTVHLVFMISETPKGSPNVGGTIGYGLVHLYSDDQGTTWKEGEGKPVLLPLNLSLASLVTGVKHVQEIEDDIDGVSSAIDPTTGAVYIVYNAYTLKDGIWRTRLLFREAGEWKKISLADGLYNSRLSITEDGTFLLLTEKTSGKAFLDRRLVWGHVENETVLLESRDKGVTFRESAVSPVDPTTPNWLPTLQRPTSLAPLKFPLHYMYTHGFNDHSQIYVGKIER